MRHKRQILLCLILCIINLTCRFLIVEVIFFIVKYNIIIFQHYFLNENLLYNMSMKITLASVYDCFIPEYEIEDYYENTKDYIVDNAILTGVVILIVYIYNKL